MVGTVVWAWQDDEAGSACFDEGSGEGDVIIGPSADEDVTLDFVGEIFHEPCLGEESRVIEDEDAHGSVFDEEDEAAVVGASGGPFWRGKEGLDGGVLMGCEGGVREESLIAGGVVWGDL